MAAGDLGEEVGDTRRGQVTFVRRGVSRRLYCDLDPFESGRNLVHLGETGLYVHAQAALASWSPGDAHRSDTWYFAKPAVQFVAQVSDID